MNTIYRLVITSCDEEGVNGNSSVIENFNTLEHAQAQMHLTRLNEKQICVLMDVNGVVFDVKRRDDSV